VIPTLSVMFQPSPSARAGEGSLTSLILLPHANLVAVVRFRTFPTAWFCKGSVARNRESSSMMGAEGDHEAVGFG
jgi:hypothetical protein